MRRAAAITLVLAMTLGAVAAGAYRRGPESPGSSARWREIAWPFGRDGWRSGRAFRCDGACAGAELYVRAKLGFCNCDRGVADDDEIDRVADLDLIAPRFAATAPGTDARVGDMPGRARRYDLAMTDGTSHAATGIAVSRRCDLLVAVVHGDERAQAAHEAALALLETDDMKRWIASALAAR